jgi:hypothetical protein
MALTWTEFFFPADVILQQVARNIFVAIPPRPVAQDGRNTSSAGSGVTKV